MNIEEIRKNAPDGAQKYQINLDTKKPHYFKYDDRRHWQHWNGADWEIIPIPKDMFYRVAPYAKPLYP